MIGYTMVGTHDPARAVHFYDRIFEEMGLERCYSDNQVASWGDKTDDTVPRFFTCKPFDGEVASVGNGTMVAFLVPEPMRIERLYDIVMQHGGSDEGPPDFRPQYGDGFYAAYVRDPDGNKLAFVCYDGKLVGPLN